MGDFLTPHADAMNLATAFGPGPDPWGDLRHMSGPRHVPKVTPWVRSWPKCCRKVHGIGMRSQEISHLESRNVNRNFLDRIAELENRRKSI